jgi:Na+-transporting methylmalonyl-CoA/oxaloacetate decarboxylase gamma subunit
MKKMMVGKFVVTMEVSEEQLEDTTRRIAAAQERLEAAVVAAVVATLEREFPPGTLEWNEVNPGR